jgi:hypothetical protein
MEHRKFLQRLDELVAELTHAQAQKVIAALQQRGDGVNRLAKGTPDRRAKRTPGNILLFGSAVPSFRPGPCDC